MTDTISHAGVKGMKWGVRKNTSDTSSSDAKASSKIKKKKLSEMSNEELKTLNTRMDLEKNYKRLNPSKVSKGKAVAATTLAAATTYVTVYNMVNSKAGQAAINVVKGGLNKLAS